MEDRRTVSVAFDTVDAYAEPQFVLEYDGKVYVTLAVIEYDPADEEMDAEERSDLSDLQRMLSAGKDVSGALISGDSGPLAMMGAQSESNSNNDDR